MLPPGPDNLDGARPEPLARGRMAGFGIAVGCALGCFTSYFVGHPGVSAALAASPMAFTALKLAGDGLSAGWASRPSAATATVINARKAAPSRPWRKDGPRLWATPSIRKSACSSSPSCRSLSMPTPAAPRLQMLVLGLVFMLQTVVVFGAIILYGRRHRLAAQSAAGVAHSWTALPA